MNRKTLVALIAAVSATFLAGCQTKPSDPNKVTKYEGRAYDIPDHVRSQPNDATISYYYRGKDNNRLLEPNIYLVVNPANNPIEFDRALETHPVIEKELGNSTILSYLYYENGKVIYDALPPSDRFTMKLNNESYFISNSVGKSINSYLVGHAICNGYIESVDAPIKDWELMKDTLYFGQPLINLLNMKSGDSSVIKQFGGEFKNTGRPLHGYAPLLTAVRTEGELKNSKPAKHQNFSYSDLTADVISSYLIQRIGSDYEQFISDFYQNKVKVEHPIYIRFSPVTDGYLPTMEKRIEQGAGMYILYATRYDYLRIATAMMDDWQQDTCEGKYLKDLYSRRVSMNRRQAGWSSANMKWGKPQFNSNAKKYGGQFWTDFTGLSGRNVLLMDGYNGQQIVMDMDNSRIVVINAIKAKHYDTKKLGYEPIKYGRIR